MARKEIYSTMAIKIRVPESNLYRHHVRAPRGKLSTEEINRFCSMDRIRNSELSKINPFPPSFPNGKGPLQILEKREQNLTECAT